MRIYKGFGNGYFKRALSMFAVPFSVLALNYILNSSPVYPQEKEERPPAGEFEIEVPTYKEEFKDMTLNMDKFKREVEKVNKKLDGIADFLKNIKPVEVKDKSVIIKDGKKLNLDERFQTLEKLIKKYFDEIKKNECKACDEKDVYKLVGLSGGMGLIGALFGYLLGRVMGSNSRPSTPPTPPTTASEQSKKEDEGEAYG